MSRVVHFEVPVDDPDRAGAFYRGVFGWTPQRWGPSEYRTLATDEEPGVGVGAEGALTPREEAPEGVLVYVGVDDIDAVVARVRAAGGAVVADKAAIPSIGWSAHVRDTEGNLIGLFQSDANAPRSGGG